MPKLSLFSHCRISESARKKSRYEEAINIILGLVHKINNCHILRLLILRLSTPEYTNNISSNEYR